MGVCKANREARTPHSYSQLSGPLLSASKARSFFRAMARPAGAITMAPSDSAWRAASEARERREHTSARAAAWFMMHVRRWGGDRDLAAFVHESMHTVELGPAEGRTSFRRGERDALHAALHC